MPTTENCDIVKSMPEDDPNPDNAFKRDQGEYKDATSEETDTEAKLPFAQLPKGTDPDPFTLGPTSPSQR